MDIQHYFPENEQPLDQLLPDGGFCGFRRTRACVGDSLSSGEFETCDEKGEHHYFDMFDYSWGQFMARICGNTVYNFSRGGMTAWEYVHSFAEQSGFWAPEKAAQAYIIALGVNDISSALRGDIELGTVADIDLSDPEKNRETFAGYYGRIIQRYRAISPDAKFFIMTPPRGEQGEDRVKMADQLSDLLRDIAALWPEAYVMDLHRYAPVYDAQFRAKFYLNGHLNSCGYVLTAKMVISYLDYIIRHNIKDFDFIWQKNLPAAQK